MSDQMIDTESDQAHGPTKSVLPTRKRLEPPTIKLQTRFFPSMAQ